MIVPVPASRTVALSNHASLVRVVGWKGVLFACLTVIGLGLGTLAAHAQQTAAARHGMDVAHTPDAGAANY